MQQQQLSSGYPLLEAVMGLVRLGSPGTSEMCPSPSVGGERVLARDVDAERKEGIVFKQTINGAIDMMALANSRAQQESAAMKAAVLGGLSAHHHHGNAVRDTIESYSALANAAMLDNLAHRSSLAGHPLTASFDANRLLSGAVSAIPPASTAMDRLSPLERLAVERALVARSLARDPAPHGSLDAFAAPRRDHGPGHGQAVPALANMNFPETLFAVLSCPHYEGILAWLPHGRGFLVRDKRAFADVVLPRHFDGAKFTSFTRRLKRWNFDRVPRGPELGAYYNKHFVRGQLDLVQKMQYRAGGQFEEGRRKDEEAREESERGKAAREVQEQEAEDVVPRDETACLPDQGSPKPHPNKVLPIRKRQVPPVTLQGGVDGPMLPPRSSPTKERAVTEAATASKSPETRPTTAHAEPLPSSRARPNVPRSHDPDQQQLIEAQLNHLLEVRRRLLSSRSEVPNNGGGGAGRGAAGSLVEHDVIRQPRYPDACASTPSLNVGLLKQMIANQELQSLTHVTGNQELQSRIACAMARTSGQHHPLQGNEHRISYGQAQNKNTDVHGARAVVLSREEGEEFARYLALKRVSQGTSVA